MCIISIGISCTTFSHVETVLICVEGLPYMIATSALLKKSKF